MNNKKIEILLESFEKLKPMINDSDDGYLYSIKKIISKLLECDKDLAINIWEYCLTKFEHYNDDYGYCNHMYTIVKCPFEENLRVCGLDDTLLLLDTHHVIKSTIYEKYYSISYDFVESLIKSNKLFELDEYLQKLKTNKLFMKNHNHDDGIGDALAYITNMSGFCPSSDCIELLLNHAKSASNENQARINVNLIDYL